MIHRAALATFAALTLLAGCGKSAVVAPVAPLAAAAVNAQSERAYPVEDLLGVGDAYGAKLRKLGIKDTGGLLDATTTTYKRHQLADASGIPYTVVVKLGEAVGLMELYGIGVRQANLLQAVGVASVAELAQRDPKNLTQRVGQANAYTPHFVDHTPGLTTVTSWIQEAKAAVTPAPTPSDAPSTAPTPPSASVAPAPPDPSTLQPRVKGH